MVNALFCAEIDEEIIKLQKANKATAEKDIILFILLRFLFEKSINQKIMSVNIQNFNYYSLGILFDELTI